jgi:uncharacterized protein (DUF1800 family)
MRPSFTRSSLTRPSPDKHPKKNTKRTAGKITLFLLCVSLACAVPQLLAKKKDKDNKDKAADAIAAEQKRAVQALNRLTFGPRPGDVQQVTAMGVDHWIDLQLHPEKIPDGAVEARLAPFRTLHMSSKEIVEEFPDNQVIKQVMDGKRPMPSDPAKRAVFQVQIARMEDKQEKKGQNQSQNQNQNNDRKQDAANAAPPPTPAGPAANDTAKTAEELAAAAAASADADTNAMTPASAENGTANTMAANGAANEMAMTPPADAKVAPADGVQARRREERLYADLGMQGLHDLPPDERYKKVMAMSTADQLTFANSLRGPGQDFLDGMDPKQKETLMAMNNPQAVVLSELVQAKLLRAIYSDRQLEQVMTDFWFNHFNVFVGKGPEREFLTNYEQEVIRPRALGKFEDLLMATAKSPAMLFYLDNWMSVGPNSPQAVGAPERPVRGYGPYGRPRMQPRYPQQQNQSAKRKASGLNENYGRELLELHTLSVNGGYSQRDVTEVAKVFTGWTIDRPFQGLGFKYEPRMHEPGPKVVLGHKIKPKGEDEGKEVLHLLATSPQTAHFISLKLAQRFVADDPPPALVDRMAKTFEKSKGDIREVLTTLFHSPEFWSDGAYRSKVKTPLEFVASAVRATGATVDDAFPLARQIGNMGMPLYSAQPPTGYSMKADTWVSSSALLGRMNFALGLTGGKVRGVKVDAVQLAGGPPLPADTTTALSMLEAKLLAGDVSKQTHDSIVAQIQSPAKATQPEMLAGMQGDPQGDKASQPKQAEGAHPADASTIAGLLLGSPEFQKR